MNVEYKFPPWTYCYNSLTCLVIKYGHSCVTNDQTSQFCNFWHWRFVLVCEVSSCQLVFLHRAGSMIFWMAKDLMTNDTCDARDAGLLHSIVQMILPWRRVSRIVTSNGMSPAYIHWSPRIIKHNLYSKITQVANNDRFNFGRDHKM